MVDQKRNYGTDVDRDLNTNAFDCLTLSVTDAHNIFKNT